VVAAPRALLPASAVEDARLAVVHGFIAAHPAAAEELGFLANAVVAGCGIGGRALTPAEASDLVLATCNLGLENWPSSWPERDLVTAFQIGWTLLDRDVCRYAASVLIDVLADLQCSDRDVQWSLQSLRQTLIGRLRDGTPWRARPALEALLVLDTSAWAVLQALIDECPAMHAVLTAPRALLRIDPAACTFIACNRDIATVRQWLVSLPVFLAG
jgi:hypothetical protein